MKRLLLLFILTIYSISAIGVDLNFYYCCDQLESVSFEQKTGSEAHCKMEMDMGGGCCKHKSVSIKIKTDQQKKDISAFAFAGDHAKLLPHIQAHFHNVCFSMKALLVKHLQRPPPLYTYSRQRLFCVFMI